MHTGAPKERPTDTETHAQPLETYVYKTTEKSGLPKRRPHSLLFCMYMYVYVCVNLYMHMYMVYVYVCICM